MDDVKLPLPKFLQLLTGNNVPVKTAMLVAGKIYKDYNTPAQLRELNDLKLVTAGINEKNVRQLVMTAFRKAGYAPSRTSQKRKNGSEDQITTAGPSNIHAPAAQESSPTKRRRKRQDINELMPKPSDEGAEYPSLSFGETSDEQTLRMKSVIINRAPVMMAWATVVAERLGFKPEEALSIAGVYTEMNAISKGVSLGIYEQGKEKGLDAEKDGSQPFVDLMGRSPLFKTQASQWRAMANGVPAPPSQAYSYITRSFRQTTSHIMGSLKMLSVSFSADELNKKAWNLYVQFRPQAEGWGKRAEMKCSTILDLRKTSTPTPVQQSIGNAEEMEAEQKSESIKYASN
ncbi:hypothetical protein JOM56_008524 [Amanita muscaria]